MKRLIHILSGHTNERPVASAKYHDWLWVDEDENIVYRCNGTQWVALDGKK